MSKDDNPTNTHLAQKSSSKMARRSDSLVRRGLRLLESQRSRTVLFPSDFSVGHVSAADNRHLEDEAERPTIDLGEARGEVVIPFDWDLELYLDSEGRANFSCLLGLQPDDLQNLVVHPRCIVMDADLSHIRHLTGLLRLSLNCQFDISDEGLSHIGQLTSLIYLDLTMAAGVTSGGLKRLANLHELQYLILLGTPLDDKAVGPLGMLKSLKYLNLENTFINEAGIPFLNVLLKECSIVHKQRPKRKGEGKATSVESSDRTSPDPTRKSLSQRVRELGGIRPSDS